MTAAAWRTSVLFAAAACLLAGTAVWRRAPVDPALVATVTRGPLKATLTATGVLTPSQSITYHSPLAGRDAAIVELVPEGTRVSEGDLLVRLDATELRRELERASQDVRQAELELQVAEAERQDALAAVASVTSGEGALGVEEARTRLQLAQKRVDRLREEFASLKPLLDRGYITREELKKTADELEQSEQELALAGRRADIVSGMTHPREAERSRLQLAQRESQLENARAKARETAARVRALTDDVANCSIYARRQGLVVYEEFLGASPRRKIRVGDRVTATQGLVTIPDVDRMLLEATVSEAEVHRVRAGQPAVVYVEAFPGRPIAGMVVRVGVLARASADRPFDDKRFDLVVALNGTDRDLRPEMTARGEVVTGTRENALLVPVNAVFDRGGTTVCHIVRRFGIDTAQVELGESNDTVVEVVGGLAEGEQLLLADSAGRTTEAPSAAAPRERARGRSSSHALDPR